MMSVAVSEPCGAAPDVTAGLSHVVFTETFLPKKKKTHTHNASECYSASAEPSSCGQRDSLPFVKKKKKSGRPNSPEIKQIMGSIMLDLRVN